MGCILFGTLASSRVVHQPRYRPPTLPGDFGLPWEDLRLTTQDKVPIAGWFIPSPNPTGVLLLLHGFGTCKADLLDLAQAFHIEGPYHLLLIDFRGHGASGGQILSFGLREVLDIQAALAFLSDDPRGRELPVGLFGISMGGAIGLLAAARFPQIRAIVSDAAYADLSNAIARAIRRAYYIPRFPLGQMVIWATQLRLRCPMRDLSPVHAIGKIAPRGVMMIHGLKDQSVPPEEGKALFQAAGEPKALWLVPEAEHVASFYKDRQEYLRRVLGFFKDAFQRAS